METIKWKANPTVKISSAVRDVRCWVHLYKNGAIVKWKAAIAQMHTLLLVSVNNFAITKSIYKDKNNKFKNKLVKAFRNMNLQYYIDINIVLKMHK